MRVSVIAVLWCLAGRLAAQTPAALLDRVDPFLAPTTVLVLGTPHLKALGSSLHREALDSLLDLLARFRPAQIAVETSPPEAVSRMDHGDAIDLQLIAAFDSDPARWGDSVQAHLGIAWDSATAVVARLLGDSPVADPRLRSALIAPQLASYDFYSGLLNWAALSPARRLPDGLTPLDTAALSAALVTPNEVMDIAIPLGVRLGLLSLVPFDDHLDDETLLRSGDLERLSAALRTRPEVQALQADTFYTALPQHLAAGNTARNLLPLYRYVNSPAYGTRDVQLQFGLFLRTHLASGLDRRRLALWEARNLEMVSNLRRAMAVRPGTPMLVIVGAGHKPFLDAYLAQLAGVRVIQLADVR